MSVRLGALDRAEALRYLGCPESGEAALRALLDEAEALVLEAAAPRWVLRELPAEHAFPGRDLAAHLQGCRTVYALCVTLGAEIDRRTRELMLRRPDLGTVFDACASVAVEQAADLACAELAQRHPALHQTGRFSPGYGDLPLACGRELLRLCDAARRLGLGMTESCLMTPMKSVCALIGLREDPALPPRSPCEICPFQCKGGSRCKIRS